MAPWDFKTKSSQSSPKKNNTRPGYVKIAIENDPVEIVDFPINSMVIFNSYVDITRG